MAARSTSPSSGPASWVRPSPAASGGPGCVALVEAGPDVGAGTSKANTAILHTGFDAKPGTVEARLVAGTRSSPATCAQAGSRSSGPALCSWPGPRNSVRRSPASPNGRPSTATTAATSSTPPSCTGASRTGSWSAGRPHRAGRVPGLPVDHAPCLRHRGGRQRRRPPPIVPGHRRRTHRRPLAARHAPRTAALRLGRQRRGPASRRCRAILRARRLHRHAEAGPAHRLRQARPPARASHPAAGAHGALEGRAREPHGLRQRPARPTAEDLDDKGDTASTADGIAVAEHGAASCLHSSRRRSRRSTPGCGPPPTRPTTGSSSVRMSGPCAWAASARPG